jgi:flagellar biosynthesis/type III secretory pathway chaperone
MARAERRQARGAEARLERLLAAERTALLAGRYDRLGSLLHRKSALIEALAESEGGAQVLARVRPLLERNLRLIGSALEGVRGARAALQKAAEPLRTYGPDGQAGPAGTAGERVVRRV